MKNGIKKLLLIVLVIMLNTLLVGGVIGEYKSAKETFSFLPFSAESREGVYQITSVEDYMEFAKTVAEGNSYEWCRIYLNNDLDFQKIDQVPVIGLSEEESIAFRGTFEGNGHVIKNLHISNAGGDAGMFANLGGTVKNLQLQDCSFEGTVCGGVTAQSLVNAAVVNCFIDAETEGEISGGIAGKFNGYLFNCVVTEDQAAGELRGGWLEQCYRLQDGELLLLGEEPVLTDAGQAAAELNAHLPRVSGFHETDKLCLWNGDENLQLTEKKAELLSELTAKVSMHHEEIELKAYYSQNDDRWCIALPAGCEAEPMTMLAVSSSGKKEAFPRGASENSMLYTCGDYQYLIDFLSADEIDTIYLQLENEKNLEYIHKNKAEKVPGMVTVLGKDGTIQKAALKGFYGHGNDSWAAQKKSYNLRLKEKTDLLGMGENVDFALLAGYRDDSLMSYVTTTTLIQDLEFEFAPEFRLVNLYVEGEYAGVYFLAEKIKLDENRIDISNLYEETQKLNHGSLENASMKEWKDEETLAERYYYEIEQQPEDKTGGYLLEIDVEDYTPEESRFVSERGIPLTMKRARCSSKEQVDYIADYWQAFEDALYSEDGKNSQGKHYSEYIDMESFVMQWLLYELVQEGSMSSSIYFYKESEFSGDGLLHACFPWDMEHSYLLYGPLEQMWLSDSETLNSYWSRYWIHEDFREKAGKIWQSKFIPAIEKMVRREPTEDMETAKNLCWYEEQIGNASIQERSRWRKMNPWNRCQEIRQFLEIRQEVLSKELIKNEE